MARSNAERPSGDKMAWSLLVDTADLVADDRDTHGDAVENQQHIAQAWTWYLQGQGVLDADEAVHGDDVACMMGLLKMSRHAVGGRDMDHMRDIAGYAGIGGACLVDQGDADVTEVERGAYEETHELAAAYREELNILERWEQEGRADG